MRNPGIMSRLLQFIAILVDRLQKLTGWPVAYSAREPAFPLVPEPLIGLLWQERVTLFLL